MTPIEQDAELLALWRGWLTRVGEATATQGAADDAKLEAERVPGADAVKAREQHTLNVALAEHAIDLETDALELLLNTPAQSVLGVGIKTAVGWLIDNAGQAESTLGFVGLMGLAAIRDTTRLTGIDLIAEYEATPGCGRPSSLPAVRKIA